MACSTSRASVFSSYVDQLVLTALAGTPAATYGPVTRTVDYCAVLPGHNLDITFGPVERNVVVALAVLPQPLTGGSRKAKFFASTRSKVSLNDLAFLSRKYQHWQGR
jgi:hypothetical protein